MKEQIVKWKPVNVSTVSKRNRSGFNRSFCANLSFVVSAEYDLICNLSILFFDKRFNMTVNFFNCWCPIV